MKHAPCQDLVMCACEHAHCVINIAALCSYSTASSGVPDGEVLTMDLFGCIYCSIVY